MVRIVAHQEESVTRTYAPFKTRIYAFLLDYLFIVLYGIFVVGTLSFVFRSFFTSLFSDSPVIAELTGFILLTLPITLYFIVCERSRWQGTLGKRKMAIRVVDSTGQRIGLGRSILRTAIKFFPWEVAHFTVWHLVHPTDFPNSILLVMLSIAYVFPLIYLLGPFTTKKRKTLYDWIAGTEVIY